MKYLGVDLGLRRVGLAISEGSLASPWKIVEVKGIQDAADKIIKIIRSESFDKIIVGMPEGQMGKNAQKFINLLKKERLEVFGQDETLSSQHAIASMIKMGISKKKRKFNDAQAAAEILQNYLDNI